MAESSWSLGRALRGMFTKPTIDENTWDDLETALLTADFGPEITERIIDELHEKVDRYRTTDPRDLQRMLKETLEEHFAKFDTTLRLTERPAVVPSKPRTGSLICSPISDSPCRAFSSQPLR